MRLDNGITFGACVWVISQYVSYVHRYLYPSRVAEYATFDPRMPLRQQQLPVRAYRPRRLFCLRAVSRLTQLGRSDQQ